MRKNDTIDQSTPTAILTNTLFNLAKSGLKGVKNQRSMASRIGVIIQSLRKAISNADLYLWAGVPHIYNGKIYVPIDPNEFKGCIYDVLSMAKMDASDFTQLEKVQRLALQAVMSKPLTLRKDIIVFENCVLLLGELIPDDEAWDLPTRKRAKSVIVPHSPELAQVTMCHFDYDPTSKCKKWETFLSNVLENMQARMVLQEFLGCIYLDRKYTKFESMLILIGNGSNGKGVVSETVRGIVGKDSMTSYGLDSILCGNESLHNIAKMNGKRANWCTEIQAIQAGRFSDKLKQIISGEPIECRQLYGLPFTATEIPLMMANCNSLPPMEDKSYGMQRRFIIIRFDKTIPVGQQDKQLVSKLVGEYPGIFNWILEGRQRYIDQHFQFTQCRSIDDAVENYMDTANNVEEWCRVRTYKPFPESAIESEALLVQSKSLYDEYCRWCIGENIPPYAHLRFASLLTRAGFTRVRMNNGVNYRLYGERAMATLIRKKKNEISKQLIENGGILNGQELKNGRVYDIGDYVASEQWHISRPYLSLLRAGRYLDGTWKRDVRELDIHGTGKKTMTRVYIYDHLRLGQRLEALGVYDQNDDRKSLSERRRDQIRRAEEFNKVMEEQGKPFRKLTGKKSHYPRNAIYVDPDWEYTPDNADYLMDFVTKLHEEKRKENEFKVGSKGKMTTKNKKELLAEAIAAKLTGGMEKEDEGYDPETGELLEIDIDDADLKISDD